jgi:hypothetical protein
MSSGPAITIRSRYPADMRPTLLVLAATLTLACQPPPTRSESGRDDAPERPPASDPASTTPPPTVSDCEREPIHAELRRYCEFDLGVPPIALANVTWTADSYHPLATRVITLDQSGVTDPEGTGTVSIAEWLATPPRRIPEPGELVFAIAADLPAASVAELWRGLAAAGRETIQVLVHVADKTPIPTPRNPSMLADLRAALPESHNERVMFVAQGVRGYATTCPSIGMVFGQLANVPMDQRCTRLAELAAAALVECGCPKLPDAMTLLYALTIGFQPPRGRAAAVEIRLDPTRAVQSNPGATWAEVARAALLDAEPRGLWIDG